MTHSNQNLIDRFFEAYKKHDKNGVRQVMSDNVIWYFPGESPVAGVKKGVDEVIGFFNTMGSIMVKSHPEMEKLIVAENERYFIECQHSKTHREDGNNLDHFSAVLWTIENGKIIEGRHFFANPHEVDKYFSAVTPKSIIVQE